MAYNNRGNSRDDKSKFGKKFDGSSKSFSSPRNNSNDDNRSRRPGFSEDRPFNKNDKDGGFKKSGSGSRSFGRSNDRPSSDDKRPYKKYSDKPFENKGNFADRGGRRSESSGFSRRDTESYPKREYGERSKSNEKASSDKWNKDYRKEGANRSFKKRSDEGFSRQPYRGKADRNLDKGERIAPLNRSRKQKEQNDDLIRLNRYIANAGICSRRKADELIEAGVVSVNGQVVTELGHKVDPYKDEVRYNGELLKREKKIYVLLNKPKDYITTTDDPQERKTVMHLVDKAAKERIYPVGRLDRNTTGLLLMTNDGDLADKLSHPRNSISKIYHVELNKNLSQGDFNKIQFGVELEDGLIKPDNISYVAGASKKEIGIQIHSGKNRIVRRIFEHLGYEVVKLDRVVYGNLTKKDLPRGRWRYLEEQEIIQLKHFL